MGEDYVGFWSRYCRRTPFQTVAIGVARGWKLLDAERHIGAFSHCIASSIDVKASTVGIGRARLT